jgi:hypothetical protein
LIYANSATQHPHHKAVELSTYGILFLGTPHQGADTVDMAMLLHGIKSIFSNVNDAILKDLQIHCKSLQQQLSLYHSISERYNTKFFYELYKTKLFGGQSKLVGSFVNMHFPSILTPLYSLFQKLLQLFQGQLVQSLFLCIKTM